jgi:uncharacterized protein YceK
MNKKHFLVSVILSCLLFSGCRGTVETRTACSFVGKYPMEAVKFDINDIASGYRRDVIAGVCCLPFDFVVDVVLIPFDLMFWPMGFEKGRRVKENNENVGSNEIK